MQGQTQIKFNFIYCGISRLHIQPHKHTTGKNYIVKIIQTTFYQQQPHKYFNLIIFNEILIIYK